MITKTLRDDETTNWKKPGSLNYHKEMGLLLTEVIFFTLFECTVSELQLTYLLHQFILPKEHSISLNENIALA